MKLTDRLADADLLSQRAFLGGDWANAASGEVISVENPSSLETIGSVPALGASDVAQAIAAAERAQAAWARTTAAARADLLMAWRDAMLAATEDLAAIMTAEQGKPLEEARQEIRYSASFVRWFAEEARRAYGETIPSPLEDRRIVVLKQPVGVSAAITPWNFPNAMITRKVAPALAAGCAAIVKPSELTPFSALALAKLAERVGIPKGVFSVVTGWPAHVGPALTGSEAVRKLSFTGSTPVGRLLMGQCAATVKRVSLELGGNAPFIVFDDADLDTAVAGLMASKFRNGGQTCVCANRIYVHDAVYVAFREKLLAAVGRLTLGDGFSAGVAVGPLINDAAVAKVEAHVADALAHGATVAGPDRAGADRRFVSPLVLDDASHDMRLAREETFGPVAPLFRFSDEREVVEKANDTPNGLSAYFYTGSLGRAWRVGEALDFGMVGLNTGAISMEVSPFGGVKQAGLGREGARQGLDEYLETKAFHMDGLGLGAA